MLAVEDTHAALELSSGWFLDNAWLIALIPAIGFALIIGLGKKMPMKGSEIGLASMAASLVIATGAGIQWMQRTDSASHGGDEAIGGAFSGVRGVLRASEGGEVEPYIEPVVTQWVWWQNSGLEFGLGSHIDGLSVLLLWLVAFISLLVQVFSLDYVRGDRRYTHFFAALTLFSSGMLVMVMSSNMVQLILGWEIMGLCSFMLIGHWWEDAYNSHSALKAFFTVRVGDVGLLVGTAILFFGANDFAVANLDSNGFDIRAIQAWALSGDGSSWTLIMASSALFIAAIGKSGQFPLHTWLPDAMAGPTPVSSLLHSSTMVVAGVFLVARIYPVFWEGFNIANGGLSFIAIIGGITIVVAALLAFVQDDIKKVLAYSTVSQLGYMMLGLGTGAWLPAVFHVFTHAFFKCCLFLAAGSISHSGSHHSFDMKKDMGGLRKFMPITFGAWCVSTLALTGVIPFAGFWSKDEIIDNVGANGYTFLFWVGLGGAALTAMYMTRATYLTFFGEPRGAAAGIHHDDDHGYATEFREEIVHADAIDRELVTAGAAPKSLSAAAAHTDDHGDDGHGDDGHDDHDDHGPHESGKLILVPIVILAFLALTSGFVNPTPLAGDALGANLGEGVELLKKYVEPRYEPVAIGETAGHAGESVQLLEVTPLPAAEEGADGKDAYATGCGRTDPEPGTVCYFPKVKHAVPELSKILLSLGVVALGYAAAIGFCIAFYKNKNPRLVGLTERSRIARGGYLFLKNKYYLDVLYQNVFVYFVSRPLAKATYWFNQNVIDGAVNGVGTSGKKAGDWVYNNIDQKIVDGVVNASGTVASETGHGLQPVQSGKVNQYGALLFGAATVGAIVLVILNVS
ncbi:MAG: NADH-quinone oxidoreductase subunit L [Ilumatobacter sp.]|uniref:NADH-quinone oxidoreductase subunit 5 family protein n=1 Tax=Ilumatobacter sp. TaxID=1967498 RepID=UPI001D9FF579|nr:NADH-quinone oxidoreductase subunit L [Ilumatobacter sp.]MBT5276805.1 NADH-quinone oxidoreductase subunit L [Ilumatobacter sp.]MBT5552332.1 NADH-quinone oxidoreductase subunit L [Ilumatobacter sp.]MBT5866387.1 NADH-quinone oxidoreductase subunit L [Ilumatobacter sp.]MBT7430706.1 NADH-quinone oxidoreductase subunit L [Ilumatobacter sp.]